MRSRHKKRVALYAELLKKQTALTRTLHASGSLNLMVEIRTARICRAQTSPGRNLWCCFQVRGFFATQLHTALLDQPPRVVRDFVRLKPCA